MLSYLIFTKPMTDQHGTGLLLIALGVFLKMVPEKKISAVARHAKSTFNMVEKNKVASASVENEEDKPLV